MTKKVFKIIILSVIIAIGLYLYLAYAHIYNYIGKINILAPSTQASYVIGSGQKTLSYVALGDSLTAGVGVSEYINSYPYLLAKKISATDTQVLLTPLAVSGSKSQEVVDNFLTKTISLNPDIITVLVGVNDIHGRVGTRKFKENYRIMLEKLSGQTSSKIYVIGIPDIGSSSLIFPPYNYYFRYEAKKYNMIIRELAGIYHVNYIDLPGGSNNIFNSDSGLYASDLFHPNERGYKLWAETIYDGINR
jgi:lysophospholipase L1-like esterase